MKFHPIAVFLFYASYLLIPYTGFLIWRLWKRKKFLLFDVLFLVFCVVFLWCRFVEPHWLRVQETELNGLNVHADVVLVADLHTGIFKGRSFVERLVEKVNAIDAQFIILAGDYVYEMSPENLANTLEPLKHLNKPTYFVMGNHDRSASIKQTLSALGLKDIEHQVVDFGMFQLAGVGDYWANDDQIKIPLPAKPTIMAAHNPDSAFKFNDKNIKLVLSGHTHCGQIRIPYLYRFIIPTDYDMDCGLQYAHNTITGKLPVYITPGVGETALPLRFLNPSTIDVLHLRP